MAYLLAAYPKFITPWVLTPLMAFALFTPLASAQTNNEWKTLDDFMSGQAVERQNETVTNGTPLIEQYESFLETQDPREPQTQEVSPQELSGWQDVDSFLAPRENQENVNTAVPKPRNLAITKADDIKADAARALSADTRLRSGDTIDIAVANVDSITGAYLISSLGTIVLPLIGSVDAVGMEADVLAAQLERLYAIDYLVNPKITVSPRARIIGNANLKGLINRQGPLPMTAVVSLAEILAQAGGVMGPRDELDAIILRSVDIAVKARRIPLAAISLTQSPGPTILPGDQITILKREKLPVIKDESGQFPYLNKVLDSGALRPY